MTTINLKSEEYKTLGVSEYAQSLGSDNHASYLFLDSAPTGGPYRHGFAFLDAEESRKVADALNKAADKWDEMNKKNVPEHLRPSGTMFSAQPKGKFAFYTFISKGGDLYESLSVSGLNGPNEHGDSYFEGAEFGKTFYALHPVGSDCKIEASVSE